MPRYLIVHPRTQSGDDLVLEDPDLALRFEGGWAVFTDGQGVCLAVPAGQGATIQRVDEQESAPQKE
ncbi:hypothetical protein [Streptomyces sp. MJP52]|uniref:hypothetical protein n=1 Tax=Streptomyces sp. MJP52 TaxID=2940555 RepID=UPI00247704CA|nr:hypothetical protein [Streptomyces sp. MJP52]MDH6224347.1 hypothetical protein [Streptomyces sp. MJP52]